MGIGPLPSLQLFRAHSQKKSPGAEGGCAYPKVSTYLGTLTYPAPSVPIPTGAVRGAASHTLLYLSLSASTLSCDSNCGINGGFRRNGFLHAGTGRAGDIHSVRVARRHVAFLMSDFLYLYIYIYIFLTESTVLSITAFSLSYWTLV